MQLEVKQSTVCPALNIKDLTCSSLYLDCFAYRQTTPAQPMRGKLTIKWIPPLSAFLELPTYTQNKIRLHVSNRHPSNIELYVMEE